MRDTSASGGGDFLFGKKSVKIKTSDSHSKRTRGGMVTNIIAFANQKGGVGKTTTAINLGTALAASDMRVLVIDLDPQGNASTGLGIENAKRRLTTFNVMTGENPLRDVILACQVPNLFVAPANLKLLAIDLMITEPGRNLVLRNAIESLLKSDIADAYRFDFVLIDCPPSLNLAAINALCAANSLIIPLQCEFFALQGLTQLLGAVEQVREHDNPELSLLGILLTMFDQRNRISRTVEADVRQTFKSYVFNTIIPRNVRLSEAPSFGKPVLLYHLACAGSQAYLSLACELLNRNTLRKAA